MADRPKGVNRAKAETRFIKISIDTKKIKKEWLTTGEKGVYLNLTMLMKPDGEVDQYDCMGMIVQDVPKDVRAKDKTLKGPILGNAMEPEWEKSNNESNPIAAQDLPAATQDDYDDLPF